MRLGSSLRSFWLGRALSGPSNLWLGKLLLAALISSDLGALPRSSAVRAEFVRSNPCPATGKPRGPCPGWEVDHRHALVCGGPDEAGNLQWLTVEEHRVKTRREVRECRRKK